MLRDSDGSERALNAGDNFIIPAGFEGEWEVLKTTKKTYVTYQPQYGQVCRLTRPYTESRIPILDMTICHNSKSSTSNAALQENR